MIAMSHSPETCTGAAQAKPANVQGAWVDAPAHLIYAVVDTPDAQVTNDLMRELQFFHWNTIDIHPVQVIEAVVLRMETLG